MSRAEYHDFLRHSGVGGTFDDFYSEHPSGTDSPFKIEKMALSAASLARIEAVSRAEFASFNAAESFATAVQLDEYGVNIDEIGIYLPEAIGELDKLWREIFFRALEREVDGFAQPEASALTQHTYRTLLQSFKSLKGLFDHFAPQVMGRELQNMATVAVVRYPAALGRNPTAVEVVELMQRSFFSYLTPLTTIAGNNAFDADFVLRETVLRQIGGLWQMVMPIEAIRGVFKLVGKQVDDRVRECPFNTTSRLTKPFLDPSMEPARVSAMHETFQIFMDKLKG